MVPAVHACLAGGTILDLMSSWVSHLPEDRRFAKVVGHGMNAAEAGAFLYAPHPVILSHAVAYSRGILRHGPRKHLQAGALDTRSACMQLARNRRLDSFFVRNLNMAPDGWALGERSFDAVLICVSVQYLQQVFACTSDCVILCT